MQTMRPMGREHRWSIGAYRAGVES